MQQAGVTHTTVGNLKRFQFHRNCWVPACRVDKTIDCSVVIVLAGAMKSLHSWFTKGAPSPSPECLALQILLTCPRPEINMRQLLYFESYNWQAGRFQWVWLICDHWCAWKTPESNLNLSALKRVVETVRRHDVSLELLTCVTRDNFEVVVSFCGFEWRL